EKIDHYPGDHREPSAARRKRLRRSPPASARELRPTMASRSSCDLTHFYQQLRTFPGAPEFKGTPKASNAWQEKSITPLWLSHAAYPLFAEASQASLGLATVRRHSI